MRLYNFILNVFSKYKLIDLTVSLFPSIPNQDQEANYQLLTVLCEENIVWNSAFCFFVLFLHLVNFSCFNSCNKGSFFSTFCEVKNILKCFSNQSILKEISPGISLEGMMLKLKLQYFGHLVKS